MVDKEIIKNIGAKSNSPNINPFEYPSEKCSCGSEVFIPGVIFKKIPGMLLGQGSETAQVPIKVFVCAKCGELSPYDKEMLEDIKKTKEDANKTNLII